MFCILARTNTFAEQKNKHFFLYVFLVPRPIIMVYNKCNQWSQSGVPSGVRMTADPWTPPSVAFQGCEADIFELAFSARTRERQRLAGGCKLMFSKHSVVGPINVASPSRLCASFNRDDMRPL